VASYKGDVDQYTSTLQALTQTPACAGTADQNFGVDNPVCGQLDLDFGAAPNLFRDATGRLLVGDLQKSGVYHVAFADTMGKDWTALVGASCQLCNAASTATDGSSVFAAGTPGGLMTALAAPSGAVDWTSPVLDGVHYQSVSTADGVVYTLDGNGFLDAFDAATGLPVLRRPVSLDVGTSAVNLSSAGVAVADHSVLVAASGGAGALTAGFAEAGPPDLPGGGYLVAYRPGG
jgi:outer membrane protein assembly factor BamB